MPWQDYAVLDTAIDCHLVQGSGNAVRHIYLQYRITLWQRPTMLPWSIDWNNMHLLHSVIYMYIHLVKQIPHCTPLLEQKVHWFKETENPSYSTNRLPSTCRTRWFEQTRRLRSKGTHHGVISTQWSGKNSRFCRPHYNETLTSIFKMIWSIFWTPLASLGGCIYKGLHKRAQMRLWTQIENHARSDNTHMHIIVYQPQQSWPPVSWSGVHCQTHNLVRPFATDRKTLSRSFVLYAGCRRAPRNVPVPPFYTDQFSTEAHFIEPSGQHSAAEVSDATTTSNGCNRWWC